MKAIAFKPDHPSHHPDSAVDVELPLPLDVPASKGRSLSRRGEPMPTRWFCRTDEMVGQDRMPDGFAAMIDTRAVRGGPGENPGTIDAAHPGCASAPLAIRQAREKTALENLRPRRCTAHAASGGT